MSKDNTAFLDPLYGDVSFPSALAALIGEPIVQRLRNVRLSNIDSLDLPGISGITRFEHALGVAHLLTRARFYQGLRKEDSLVLLAAGLLHDSAITPYGHLLEEAFSYRSSAYNHETKWRVLVADPEDDPSGMDTQIYYGRASGLRRWSERQFGEECKERLTEITGAIAGEGRFGKLISGDVDVDNLDNVVRAAFHMGLKPDLTIPTRVVAGMTMGSEGELRFSTEALAAIQEWVALRSALYARFMLSPADFSGKLMLLSSCVRAIDEGVLDRSSWTMSDPEFVHLLTTCQSERVRAPAVDWMLGRLWPMAHLHWFENPAPSLKTIDSFAEELSRRLSRECFAYRIKDKRHRQLCLLAAGGSTVQLGKKSDRWVLGVGSSARRAFERDENEALLSIATKEFQWKLVGAEQVESQQSLF